METDSGDNELFVEVIAAQNDFEPIRIETDGVKFDKDLIDEFEDKVGDIDIVCQGGEKLRCHSCVISCQSNVMRRSLRRGLDDSQLNCPKFTHTTMSKLLQIMYCSDASFEYANEMIEILFAAAYYNLPWVVAAVQKSTVSYCTRAEDNVISANRCRDVLLILQENVTYTMEQPNPTYAPFDPCLQGLTDELIARLQNFARQGIVPSEADPVRITNVVLEYLETEPKDRQITRSDSMMAELSFYYSDTRVDQNEIFNGILRRISVLQNLLIGIIPDMAPSNNPPPPPPPDNPPPPPPANPDRYDLFGWRGRADRRGRRGWPRLDIAGQQPRQAAADPLAWMGGDDAVAEQEQLAERMARRQARYADRVRLQREQERIARQNRIREELQEQRNRELRVEEANRRVEESNRQLNRHEEHIRQARERMNRIRRQAELDALTRRASQAVSQESQEIIKEAKKTISSKSDCKAGLQSLNEKERLAASKLIALKIERYRGQLREIRIGPLTTAGQALETLRGKLQTLAKLLSDVPRGRRLMGISAPGFVSGLDDTPYNYTHGFMTHQIADLQSQVESQIRRTNMLELPFGGSPYSTPRLHMPRTKHSTQDEGPKTKKRKLDEPEPKATLVQPKSLNIQKLQKALTKVMSHRRTESTQKDKNEDVVLVNPSNATSAPKPSAEIKTEPVIKIEPTASKSPKQPQREAIWIVETDSDNDLIFDGESMADQPGPSGLQQNKKDAASVEKPDEEDESQ